VFIEQGASLLSRSLQIKAGMMNGIFAVPDYEPAMPAFYEKYFKPPRHRPWHGRVSTLPGRLHRPTPKLAKLLDLTSVRYYASPRPIRADLLRKLQLFVGEEPKSMGGVYFFERSSALPRAYVVRRILYEPNVEAALTRIKKDSFRPREEAVLVDPDRDTTSSIALDPSPPGMAGEPDNAEITSYSTEEVAIAAECRSDCLLVLTDLYYAGWRVYVDEQEQKIHRVNALFRGVQLERGTHRVVYRYEPMMFRIGCWMLVLTLLGITAGLAYSIRRRYRATASI
jgi:hypothetical protein